MSIQTNQIMSAYDGLGNVVRYTFPTGPNQSGLYLAVMADGSIGTKSENAGLLPATPTTIGGVIVPASGNLSVDGSGNLSVVTPALGTSQIVWVSIGGSDVTGNGSINYPFASVAHAIAAITDNSASKKYVINILGGGTYTETAIAMKPFVFLNGVGGGPWFGQVRINLASGSFTLDATMGGLDGNQTGFSNIRLGSACNFDGSAYTHAYLVAFDNCNCLAGIIFKASTSTAAASQGSSLQMNSVLVLSGDIAMTGGANTLRDCQTLGNISYLGANTTDTTNGGSLIMICCNQGGSLSFSTAGANDALALSIYGCNGSTAGTTITRAAGGTVTALCDAISYPATAALLTLGGGATLGANTRAIGIGYTAAVAANWAASTPPITLQAALDRIAAHTTGA